jgi:S-adenosylmethionine:tRNA ribosyltransferase-isomerase
MVALRRDRSLDVRRLGGCGRERHNLSVRARRADGLLDPAEAVVDALPSARHQLDDERKVVDARIALGKQLLLNSLQPAVGLVGQPFDLRQRTSHREYLAAHALPHGVSDTGGKLQLELHRGGRESLDLRSRAIERRLQSCRLEAAVPRRRDALAGSFQRLFVHGRQGYSGRRMRSSELDYDLPQELVAQCPPSERDASRLLVFDRASGEVRHRIFRELPEELARELVVVNDTRVIPARLRPRRESGGAVEVLLIEPLGGGTWEALCRPSRRLRPGERLGPVELLEPLGGGRWRVLLEGEPAGEPPLPPYIHEPLADAGRYQTVYANEPGSAAAPTAGLHFSPALLGRLDVERVTLHVGLDTFRPLTTDALEEHVLHGERYQVEQDAWARIATADRVLAVGTTTVRVLETVMRTEELRGRTSLFVTPGFEFRRVDALLTNFHLPRSTLLALVMAFAGVESTRELYRVAIAERYRFYSFGDAMLVL